MATILRQWSYQYQWLYQSISAMAALSVGGLNRFHQLAFKGLNILPEMRVLDLCCGAGVVTKQLTQQSAHVTGLDISPLALERAQHNAPQATFVEAPAERLPFAAGVFDLIHTCVAIHEMTAQQRQQIFQGVYRVLKPGGVFTLIDFHAPTNQLLWPPVAIFCWLFETETAWDLLRSNLVEQLTDDGFTLVRHDLYAGGSLQVIQMKKPSP